MAWSASKPRPRSECSRNRVVSYENLVDGGSGKLSPSVRAAVCCTIAVVITACHSAPPRKPAAAEASVTLAVLPAESSKFPQTAHAITESLAKATVSGVDHKELSKVSLEVVQLSIECVEPSPECYAEVGKSLAANRLLFAEVSASGKRKVQVTVTLFDVDAKSPKTATRTFASEREAAAGAADLVAEATR